MKISCANEDAFKRGDLLGWSVPEHISVAIGCNCALHMQEEQTHARENLKIIVYYC